VKTRKLLITLLIIVLVVVYCRLGIDYMKQDSEREALASQITDATQTLVQMPKPPDYLDQQLSAAQASLAAEQSTFPGEMNSTNIVNTILKLAEECEVKAIPLITQPWTTENSSDNSYAVFRLNVAVTGTFTQLVSFLSKLENGGPRTLIVEDLSVTTVTEPSGGKNAPEGTVLVNTSLDLAIYAQTPTSE
jgi:Tfp pilus assembly protein PilO